MLLERVFVCRFSSKIPGEIVYKKVGIVRLTGANPYGNSRTDEQGTVEVQQVNGERRTVSVNDNVEGK